MGDLNADLLVLGGGMAGLAAAARAAESGARVVVVEKGAGVGGSAAMAAGILWTAPDLATLREVAPRGDPELGRALVEGFGPAIDWVRSMDVFVSECWSDQFGFGLACRADMPALLAAMRSRIEASGGRVVLGSAGRVVVQDRDGRTLGARVVGPEGDVDWRAEAVLLATGGFQGNPDLVASIIAPAARRVLVRSNAGSTGDGLRMGRAAGGAVTLPNDGFYGHLVPSPMETLRPDQYLPLTQYYSNHCVLVNLRGERFTEESLGDDVSNQAVVQQPRGRAILVCDQDVRERYASAAPYPHGQVVDRIAAAEAAGGRVARADTVGRLVAAVSAWGVGAEALGTVVAEVGQARLARPPFYALEVQPTITFPFAGLTVDVDGRVLDFEGAPIPGLFAAGADAGGLQHRRYVGGLALGLVFGPRAAEAALGLRGSTTRVRA